MILLERGTCCSMACSTSEKYTGVLYLFSWQKRESMNWIATSLRYFLCLVWFVMEGSRLIIENNDFALPRVIFTFWHISRPKFWGSARAAWGLRRRETVNFLTERPHRSYQCYSWFLECWHTLPREKWAGTIFTRTERFKLPLQLIIVLLVVVLW